MSVTEERPPLEEIERTVQARARRQAIDVATEAGAAALRALIDDEVRRWNDEHRRGLRAVALADPDDAARRAWRNLAGYGPLDDLLADDDVWEIMINAPDGLLD